MMNYFFRSVCFLGLALALTGCGMSSGKITGNSVHVSIKPQGDVVVNNDVHTSVVKLPGLLKSMGATPSTAIVITVPKQVTQITLKDICAKLATAGFRKIVFTKPLEMEASAGPIISPAPTITNAPPSKPAAKATPKASKASSQKPVRSGTL